MPEATPPRRASAVRTPSPAPSAPTNAVGVAEAEPNGDDAGNAFDAEELGPEEVDQDANGDMPAGDGAVDGLVAPPE